MTFDATLTIIMTKLDHNALGSFFHASSNPNIDPTPANEFAEGEKTPDSEPPINRLRSILEAAAFAALPTVALTAARASNR